MQRERDRLAARAAEARAAAAAAAAAAASPAERAAAAAALASAESALRAVPWARPLESDILVFHYVLEGPEGTPYAGGYYHGLIKFPTEYPLRPPSVLMLTPSGRFEVNQRICLSMSDYHVRAARAGRRRCAATRPLTHSTIHSSHARSDAARDVAAHLVARQDSHWPAVLHDQQRGRRGLGAVV